MTLPIQFASAEDASVPCSSALYRRLLAVRVVLGCWLIDHLCHGREQVLALYQESNRLDDILEQYQDYRERDYTEAVLAAELRRYHAPGATLPADHGQQPCSLCRKAAVDLDPALTVPVRWSA